MDAREDLARLVDAFGGAGAQCVEGAAPGAVNRSKADYVNRHATITPKVEPALLGGDPAPAALAGRQ